MALSPSGRGTARLTSLIGLLGGVSFDSSPPRPFVVDDSVEVSTFLGLLRNVLARGLSGAVVTDTLDDGLLDWFAARVAVAAAKEDAVGTCTVGSNLGGGNGRL